MSIPTLHNASFINEDGFISGSHRLEIVSPALSTRTGDRVKDDETKRNSHILATLCLSGLLLSFSIEAWPSEKIQQALNLRNFPETPWTMALSLFVGGALVYAIYSSCLRRATRLLNRRMQTRLMERERMARDLHDSLLQNVQGLLLQFQTVANQLPAEGTSRCLMEKVLDDADRVLAHGRHKAMDLCIATGFGEDLDQLISELGNTLSEGSPTAFFMTITGKPSALHHTIRDELYKVGREALFNAFRHANAKRIETELIYCKRQIVIQVRDDGKGMDNLKHNPTQASGHWGIAEMQQRMRKIHGELQIWSRTGIGTEILLKAPNCSPGSNWSALISRSLVTWTK